MTDTKDTSKEEAAEAEKAKRKFTEVTLENPIVRGTTTISKVTLRKPKGGDMRGLTTRDLMNGDVNSVIALIPRISDPALIDKEAEDLEAEDIAEFSGAISGFFMNAQERAAMNKMIRGTPSE